MSSSDISFAHDLLKRLSKSAVKYSPTHHEPTSSLFKRKDLLPVPPTCLTTATLNNQVDPSSERVILTVKTLKGAAYKLPTILAQTTGADLYKSIRHMAGCASSSNVKILRQGRVIPDSDSIVLASVVADPSVSLNLIEQQVGGLADNGKLGKAFWKDLEGLVEKHMSEKTLREKICQGFREKYEELID